MKIAYYILGAVTVVVVIAGVVLFLFIHSGQNAQTPTSEGSFDTAPNNATTVTSNSETTNGSVSTTQSVSTQASEEKIFEIASGPVAGATLIETSNPTTTLARYIDQDDGHVYDLPLDVPGAIPQVVSDTTIPGVVRALWTQGGNATIMQYLDTNGTIKTLYMNFAASSTASAQITFLPDAIEDVAVSPDGKSVAYLLTTASGIDGYVANADGTGSKKLFSLPLSQVLLSWPAQSTLLAQSKSAVGTPGIAFSIDVKSGTVTPLIYAPGLTAIADPAFSNIVYQSVATGATLRLTYVHNVKSGLDALLSFSPFPEKCIWSAVATTTMYCAAPLQYEPANYLDLWHQGLTTAADSIFSFNIATNQDAVVASPGSSDGGQQSDISEMGLSPDEHYLDFVTKGDRSLWGVRLTQ